MSIQPIILKFRGAISYGIVAVLWIWPLFVNAQKDTLQLQTVTIKAPTFQRDIAGVQLEHFHPDSIPFSNGMDVAYTLEKRSNIILRGYGPGGSMGLSIRGASTSQSQVLIDGVPFENPSLGFSDLSLLPLSAFSTVSLYRGSSAAYLGSAAIGGSLLLNTDVHHSNYISQRVQYGSFGSLALVTSAALSSKKWTNHSSVYYRESDNDFRRPGPAHAPAEQNQPHAYSRSKGFSKLTSYQMVGGGQLKLFLFGNETFREIPPILSKPGSAAKQQDQNFRAQVSYSKSSAKSEVNTTFSFDNGLQKYTDPEVKIDDAYTYQTYHGQLRLLRKFGRLDVFGLSIFRVSRALSDYYSQKQNRFSPALSAGMKSYFFSGKTVVSAVLRQEMLNGMFLPLIPTISASHELSPTIRIRAAAGLAYRVPTLNDLYWKPGGNPQLKPEAGQSHELGLDVHGGWQKLSSSFSISGFHRRIDNWIIWSPGPGFWSPENLREVQSLGVEGQYAIVHPLSSNRWSHTMSVTYAQSKNLNARFDGDRSAGKQLIYIPYWSFFAKEQLDMLEGRMNVMALCRFVSRRFITYDNTRSLDPYVTADVEFNYVFSIQKSQLFCFAAVRNILNATYQLQAAYPMPGRAFEVGIYFKSNLKNR